MLVDQERCRGYQECLTACPYKKTMFNLETRVSEKCIGCYPKLEQGLQTAVHDGVHRPPAPDELPVRARRRRPAQAGGLPRPHPQDRPAAVPAARPRAERLLHPARPRPHEVPDADVRPGRRRGDRDVPEREGRPRASRAAPPLRLDRADHGHLGREGRRRARATTSRARRSSRSRCASRRSPASSSSPPRSRASP